MRPNESPNFSPYLILDPKHQVNQWVHSTYQATEGLTMWRSRFLFMLGLAVVAFLSVVLSLQTFRATGEPWQLTFMGEGSRLQLAIVCEKPLIPITEIVLDNIALNSPIKHQVVFTDLDIALPLGQLTFADLTTLPGRITLSLFDQEIDLMQRALMINGIEYEWGTPITLQPRLSRESDS